VRVLVTGGAGFIGSHLCDHLLKAGHEVVCLDNLFTGSRDNLAGVLDHPSFELIEGDVVEPRSLQIDRIFHLACPASPIHYQTDPVQTVKTCVVGTLQMLELARETGARILLSSTSEVYGDPEEHPQTESYRGCVNPIGLRSCYDEGKRVAETLCFDFHRQYGVEIRVVRIFNTYGPRLHPEDGRVVSNFILQAFRGEPLTLYGEGQQTRCFCYVDDLVDGLLRMMDQDDHTGPINLGNPDERTIRQLADEINTMTGNSGGLTYRSLPQDDPKRRCPDISLAREVLGWEPTTSLQTGLKATIEYFEALVGSRKG
jgi:UDP-glucuronate decarboxylase